MEKGQSLLPKQLSPPEWDLLFEDFKHGGARLLRWTSPSSTEPSLIDLALSSITRKDVPIIMKLNILVFLDEFFDLLYDSSFPSSQKALISLLETLRSVIQSPLDSAPVALKEQILISTTSIFISVCCDISLIHVGEVEGLIELLLRTINHPNHGAERQIRGLGCECLREMERACPCLLSEVSGQLWGLCQSERTHVGQSYALLLTTVVHNIVDYKPNISVLNDAVPLSPFNCPRFVVGGGDFRGETWDSNQKATKRVMAFLLEWPNFMTPCGIMEFMSMILPLVQALGLQASLLKVKLSGMLYSYHPMLCHSFLMLHSHFSDVFEGKESEIGSRLVLISREAHQHLVFRLLALHWLLGLSIPILNKESGRFKAIVDISQRFYPSVYDPLCLKLMKLDLLVYISILVGRFGLPSRGGEKQHGCDYSGIDCMMIFEGGIASVSAFQWLPSWSSETLVVCHSLHKFFIGSWFYSNVVSLCVGKVQEKSTLFFDIMKMTVDMTLKHRGFVYIATSLIDRLLSCPKHRCIAENLLQMFDAVLLPQMISTDHQLPHYFPIFCRIAETDTIPPSRLIKLLTGFMLFLSGSDLGLGSWSPGSRVIGICRSFLVYHPSSRLFPSLTRLLALTCLYFPDIDVRDDARVYLRMLISLPGKKIRSILCTEGIVSGMIQLPDTIFDIKKSRAVSSFMSFRRLLPLITKHSWSLSVPISTILSEKPLLPEAIVQAPSPNTSCITSPREPLRITDAKTSAAINTLRCYFSLIPAYSYSPDLKVHVPCSFKLITEVYIRSLMEESAADCLEPGQQPALYSLLFSFSSSAPYGSIPSRRFPIIIGEPPGKRDPPGTHLTTIELQPREPTPGLVEVKAEANTRSGKIIHGQLQGVPVGIEDMFLKAIAPQGVSEDDLPGYYSDLFDALWGACGPSSSIGREAFLLKGGKETAMIIGTRSVKLLNVTESTVVRAVECHLAMFVVGVEGEALVGKVKAGSVIRDVVWGSRSDPNPSLGVASRLLKPMGEDEGREGEHRLSVYRKNGGCIRVLIFLPPKCHLLFWMEVSEMSTLVGIRTDHWPCLAYVDEYLETIFLT